MEKDWFKIFSFLGLSLLLTAMGRGGPSTQEVLVSRIGFSSPEELSSLVEMGLDIDVVHRDYLIAYLNSQEFNMVESKGFEIVRIPNYAKLMADSLWEATKDSKNPMAEYHTYEELTQELDSIATEHPDICCLESIGQSVQGRELWFMKISDNVSQEEDESEFKYISTMHGDEPVGTELLMYLINHLVDNYGTDSLATYLVDNTEIWIMPLMNPDGNALHQRWNVNGEDLNRDFPDPVKPEWEGYISGREPETQAVMNFCFGHSFVSSANFHTGALVVNYPWDSAVDQTPHYEATPDDSLFIYISEAYSIYNEPMWNGSFYHGITNGAAWYVIYGGMQDWNYNWLACNEVTIELYDTKWPDPSVLPGLWEDNREAMLAYMEQCHRGISGLVTDATTDQPLAATVSLLEIGKDVYTDPDVGDYHRMLLPGTYTIRVTSNGYRTVTRDNIVVTESITEDFQLVPLPVHYYTQSTPLPIPDDSSWVQSYIEVPDSIEIEDINIFLSVTHSYFPDLIIDLKSPQGTSVRLWNQGYAQPGTLSGWFDTEIEPIDSMSHFIGENAEGQWALWLKDCADGNVGTLNLWRLEIYGTGTVQDDSVAPVAISDLSVHKVVDTSVTLVWTAPGDDGTSGTASIYDLRYSVIPIGIDTVGWWNSAETVSGEPSPSLSGMSDSCTIQNLLSDTTYYFVIRTADEVPNWSGFSNVAIGRTTNVRVGGLTDFAGLPESFELFQNSPNPFNPVTEIRYNLPVNCQVKLEVYNVLGEKVTTLIDGQQTAGYRTVSWDASNHATGVYFYQLIASRFNLVGKMVLLR